MSFPQLSGAKAVKAALLFAALGEPTRLALVARLSDNGPLATSRLGRDVGVSRQALTKHLRVLETAGLVSSARVGRDRQWQMQVAQLAAARGYLEAMAKQWDLRIERLKAFVEAGDTER